MALYLEPLGRRRKPGYEFMARGRSDSEGGGAGLGFRVEGLGDP